MILEVLLANLLPELTPYTDGFKVDLMGDFSLCGFTNFSKNNTKQNKAKKNISNFFKCPLQRSGM